MLIKWQSQHNTLWTQFLAEQAPKLWNNLPDFLRASSDFKTVKKLLANESLFYYLRNVSLIDFANDF